MLYDLILNDIEPEIEVSAERVIEYAKNRLIANPEEISDWNVDINNLTIEDSINIINSFNEEVYIIETPLIEILNDNNGSVVIDWGVLNSDENKTAVITEELEECTNLLSNYRHRIDLILPYDEYTKCDVCQKIYLIEETAIDSEDGDIICYKCKD